MLLPYVVNKDFQKRQLTIFRFVKRIQNDVQDDVTRNGVKCHLNLSDDRATGPES